MKTSLQITLFAASLSLVSFTWAADTCNGKNATKVINMNTAGSDAIAYGTSGNDVWVVKGSTASGMLLAFFDLQAAHAAVDNAPAGSASGGNDSICIVNPEAPVAVYAKQQYRTYVNSKSYHTAVRTNYQDGEGRLEFIVNYQGGGQAQYDVRGTEGDDYISIKAANSQSLVYGYGGDDTIELDANQTQRGNFVDAGSGDDVIFGSAMNDIIIGGIGEDEIWGNGGDDFLVGADADTNMEINNSIWDISAYAYRYTAKELYSDEIVTVIRGDTNRSRIYGGDGDDVILGSDGYDSIEGEAGNEWIYSYDGSDRISLGWHDNNNGTYSWTTADGLREGSFTIETFPDNDGGKVWGGNGTDMIWGSDGNDYLAGEADNDRVFGMGGNDELRARECGDRDYAYGMGGSDKISYCTGDWVFTAHNNGFIAQ